MKKKILICLFFIAVFINFLGPIIDVDFPFHLKTGEYIYKHREIPKDDPFSFYGEGVLTDRERFTLSQYWLSQILFYKLYSSIGPAGIILLRAGIFFLFIFLLWYVLRKRGTYSSLLIVIIVTINLLPYKLDRPQLFSFLFVLLLILLLEKFRERPNSFKPLFFIPLLMIVWSNMHAGFVFGLSVILIYALSESFKLLLKKIKLAFPVGQPLPEKSLLMLLSASLLAITFSYINPDFNGPLITTFESHTETKWLYYGVREYMSPVEETKFPYKVAIANISFWILLGYTSILLSLNMIRGRSINITSLGLIIFSSIAALTSVRYVPLFLGLSLPLSKDWRFFKDAAFLKRYTGSPVMFIIFSIFLIFSIGFGLKVNKDMFKIGKHSFYPENAATFLLDNKIDTRMFNSNNRGSYLIWKLYPYYKVFQDTRYISIEATIEGFAIRHALHDTAQTTEQSLGEALSALVPEELGKIEVSPYKSLNNSEGNKPLWKKLLKQHNIDLIVHEATADYTGEIFPITLRLLKDDEWVLIYLDGKMMIFIKNDEKYSDIIKKYKKPKELIYDEIILETSPLVKNKITFPGPYSSLALALTMKGYEEDARKMIDAALELDKKNLVANFSNAYLALRQKNSGDSEHSLRELRETSYVKKQLAK